MTDFERTTITRIVFSGRGQTEEEEVIDRDLKRDAARIPSWADSIVYYDAEARVNPDGSTTLIGGPFNRSKKYYVGGWIYSMEKLMQRGRSGDQTMVVMMIMNDWKYVVSTRLDELLWFNRGAHEVYSTLS